MLETVRNRILNSGANILYVFKLLNHFINLTINSIYDLKIHLHKGIKNMQYEYSTCLSWVKSFTVY